MTWWSSWAISAPKTWPVPTHPRIREDATMSVRSSAGSARIQLSSRRRIAQSSRLRSFRVHLLLLQQAGSSSSHNRIGAVYTARSLAEISLSTRSCWRRWLVERRQIGRIQCPKDNNVHWVVLCVRLVVCFVFCVDSSTMRRVESTTLVGIIASLCLLVNSAQGEILFV